MISASPRVCKNKTSLWYVFTLVGYRCFYLSTDLSDTDPQLIGLFIAPDYVPYLTSFVCESRLWNSAQWVPKMLCLRQHVKSCLCEELFTIPQEGFQKQDASEVHNHWKKKIRFPVILHWFMVIICTMWNTWVQAWAKLHRERLPWDKMRRVTTQVTQGRFKIRSGDYFTLCFNRGC